MRLNRYLASTLFTGLFVTASIFTPAMGQEQSLQPKGDWSIAKIDRAAQGGNSYCTLSRKYDNGVVLSLGRNQTEEYSLAIDFQKQVFEKGKSLKINLQPGPGQIRAYDMMPASEKAVVVRLGWDAGFFDTLNKSQQMKVKIADKNYTFAMPEISKGQSDLRGCMEELQQTAKDAKGEKTASVSKDVLNADPKADKQFDAVKADDKVAMAAPAAAPVANIAAQKEQVAAQEKSVLQSFAESIKSQEPELNGDEAPKRKNFASKSSEEAENPKAEKIADVPRREKPAAVQVEPAKKVELVERPAPSAPVTPPKIAAKEEAPAAAKMAAMSPAAAFEKSEAETKALQKQIDDLIAQNKALQAKASTPSVEAQQQLQALQAEKTSLQQKLDAAQKDKAAAPKQADLAEAQARVLELEAKNAQLEDSLRQAQVRIGEAAVNTESKSIKRITELESKLTAAQNDNNALAKQLESLRVQQEDKSLVAVAGDWDLEQATMRYNEAEREIRRLGLQLEQERTSCNREKAQIEQMLFDPAVADQKQIERLTRLENELSAAQAKVADTQKLVQDQVNQQVAAQVAQKTQSVEASKAGMSAQIVSLQKSLADREASIASMQKTSADTQAVIAQKDQEIAALKAQPKADPAQVAALQAQIKSMSDALAQKDKAFAEAQNASKLGQSAIMQKDQEIAALKAQPKADPAQVAALQAQIKSMSDAIALKDKAVADAQAAAKAAQTSVAQKDMSAAQKDQEIAALKAQPKADPAQVAALQAQIKAMSDAIAMKDKAMADAQAAAKTAQTDQARMTEIQNAMNAIKADNNTLRDQNVVLRQDAEKLRLQLADITTNSGARADQLASLLLQIDTLKRQAATKDTQLATYQNQLAAAQQESTQLKTRLTVSDSQRSGSTEEVGALTRQIQQLQRQVNDLQSEKARRPERSAMADTYAGITPAAGYVSSAAAPVSPVMAQPVAAIASTALPTGAAMAGYDQGAIQSLLQKSGVNVARVTKASSGFAGADNFNWTDSSNVKGLASVKMSGNADFDSMINQYITYQKGQCSGDFASMPSPTNGSAAKKMALYEVACVGSNGQSQSASLLFFEDQGRFIAIANQIDAANMDIAMDSRDKIAGFVRGL